MPVFNRLLIAGIASLSLAQAWAQQDDGIPKVTDPSIPLSYVGNNGSIAIGINSEGESEGKLTGIFARNDERAFIEQLWWDRSGAGGIQSDYNWLWGMTAQEALQRPEQATVARLSFALDQNGEHDRKATLGFGIERRAFSIEGYVARGITAARTDGSALQSNSTTIAGNDELGSFTQVETTSVETVFASKPFNSEVGLQVSHFFEPLSMRVHGGASFQNGDGARSNTLSVGVDAPLGKGGWGIAGLAEHVNASGGIDARDDDRFSLFLRYEFGRHGSFVPTSQLEGPAWIARSLARDSTAHSRTVETYRVRRSQTTSITRSPKAYTNLFPVAADDTASVSSGASISIDVLANDNDPEGGTLSLLSVSAPTNGTAVIAGNQIIYTPAAGFTGVDAFRYTVSDSQGGTASGLVNVTVAPQINHPPVVRDVAASVMFGQSVAINLLANVSDADGDALNVVSVGTPMHGTVSRSGNVATYTPESGFSGQDWFTYTVSDGRGGESTGTVRITVGMQPNHNPIANDDAAITTGAPVVVNVLANDIDPDGDTLSLASVTTPVNGGTAAVSGNAVTYSPPTGFIGTDRFSYTIQDGRGGMATATVRITVAMQPNQNPIATDDAAITTGLPVVINVLANDSDPDGDPLSILSVTPPVGGGTAVISGNAVTYTPSASFVGTDRFLYTISDGRGGTATAMVMVTVAPAPNQPPVAMADSYPVGPQFGQVVLHVLDNDSDPDGDPLTIVAVTQPICNGPVVISDAGQTVTFTQSSLLFSGSFTYTISDGHGHTASANVTIGTGPVALCR